MDPAFQQVSAALLARGDKVLICQRRLDGSHPGKWEFPGGKVEAGESPRACLRRELREELGIDAVPGAELFRVRHHYPDGFACEIAFIRIDRFSGMPANRCFADMRWAPLDTLRTYDFLDADRAFVRLLDDGTIDLRAV